MLSINFSKLRILAFVLFTISSSYLSADLEQKLLTIDASDRKVTFTFFHFDSTKSATLAEVPENLGKTAVKGKSIAAISASAQTDVTFESGNFIFPASTTYLIKDAALASPALSPRRNKYTFILTNESGRHALCYAPTISESELGYALLKYIASSKAKYTTAVIIDSGNQCGFYKSNGKYLPYYLKELKKPDKALTVK